MFHALKERIFLSLRILRELGIELDGILLVAPGGVTRRTSYLGANRDSQSESFPTQKIRRGQVCYKYRKCKIPTL